MTEQIHPPQKKISPNNTPQNVPIEDGGRTVIIRGPIGEIIISSASKDDKLDEMVKLASKQYQKHARGQIYNGETKQPYIG